MPPSEISLQTSRWERGRKRRHLPQQVCSSPKRGDLSTGYRIRTQKSLPLSMCELETGSCPTRSAYRSSLSVESSGSVSRHDTPRENEDKVDKCVSICIARLSVGLVGEMGFAWVFHRVHPAEDRLTRGNRSPSARLVLLFDN